MGTGTRPTENWNGPDAKISSPVKPNCRTIAKGQVQTPAVVGSSMNCLTGDLDADTIVFQRRALVIDLPSTLFSSAAIRGPVLTRQLQVTCPVNNSGICRYCPGFYGIPRLFPVGLRNRHVLMG